MDIEDLHPLREKVDIHHITPILTRCFKSKKKDFKPKLRQAMLQELGMKVPKSEREIQKDPFLILGYGVNAFFDILFSLCVMFCCISIFALPIFYTYSKLGQSTYFEEKSYPISRLMLGNMGGATMFCSSALMEKPKLDVQCPYGLQLDGKHALFGLISTEHE
jgi:hypothetical protein